jgi:predicted MPP superfamily phosphohydrolase
VEISFDNRPAAFDGYKIVQISDVHAGSFDGSVRYFQKAADLINSQQPDLIVFTGDMVNNFAEETVPLIPIFSQLYARDGKYAVLGNHDYGGYYDWDTPADSVNNHETLKSAIEKMGFALLNNQSAALGRDHSDSSPDTLTNRIALIGTENWGKGERRPKYADLEKATETVRDIPFKLLLSHDPLFWHETVKDRTDISLTLSGHTHGMQFGVKLGKKRYSFGILRGYRYLAGLYQTNRKYLYVNRGLGVIGFPGRIGMSPEITVITLRKEGCI